MYIRLAWIGFVLVSATAACSGRRQPPADGDVDADVDADLDGDASSDVDADTAPDADRPDPADLPHCGDGVVDDGEECDDGNRLNGDSCDWLCQLGGGEPPPEPDPSVSEYEPSGEPVEADDLIGAGHSQARLPLTWSTVDYATAYMSEPDGDLRFHRFDASGRGIDSDWEYPDLGPEDWSVDLVRRGSVYGLFFAVWRQGIYFLELDDTGKPLGDLVLVTSDVEAYHVAADLTPSGYVVVWSHCGPGEQSVRLLLVDAEGSTDGLPEPLVLAGSTCVAGDVATGPDGYGVSMGLAERTAQFVRVSEGLGDVVTSGTLSAGYPGDVLWSDGGWVTGLTRCEDTDGESCHGSCVARFTPSGVLEAAPACNDVGANARLAAGDRGLALVFRTVTGGLLFVRTDTFGAVVGAPREVPLGDPLPFSRVDSVGMIWADGGFSIVFGREHGTLMLTRFVTA